MKTAEFGQPCSAVPQPGKCRVCGNIACEDGGPVGPTEWADHTRTLCDEPDCIAAAKREIGINP